MPMNRWPPTEMPLTRSATELGWFRRRAWLSAGTAWVAALNSHTVQAQSAQNPVIERSGDVRRNGHALADGEPVALGDLIETGPDGALVAVLGGVALRVRSRSRVVLGSAPQPLTQLGQGGLDLLRVLTGAVVAVWRPGPVRQVRTPNVTLGIRGTGTYVEVFAQPAPRSYFCNCYGTVELNAADQALTSQSQYHQSFWIEAEPVQGQRIRPARAINHTDEELEALAALLGERTAWQIAGRKGVKDGRGYLDAHPAWDHPAQRIPAPRGR